MSFLDLDLSADCAVWREMLTHEQSLEQHAASKLGATFQGMPPTVLRSFLTHRHTHSRLLPPADQRALDASIASSQFTFDRNPNRSWEASGPGQSPVKKGEVFALTRGLMDHTDREKVHLPKDGRLEYLYAADHLNRMDLYPRQAKTYTRGEWFDSHLRGAAKPPNPHPGHRAHAETSTYRRATTGRRHTPFPARQTGASNGHQQQDQHQQQQQASAMLHPRVASEEKEDAFCTPAHPTNQTTPHAPLKASQMYGGSNSSANGGHPTPASFPRSMTPLLQGNTPAHAMTARPPTRPHRQQQFPPSAAPSSSASSHGVWSSSSPSSASSSFSSPPLAPGPAAGSQSARPLPTSASAYTNHAWREKAEPHPRSTSHHPTVGAPGPSPPDASMSGGFARHGHLRFASPRSVEPLLQTVPVTYAGYALHKYDHHSSFGRNGVYQAVPQTKEEHGLHASHRLW